VIAAVQLIKRMNMNIKNVTPKSNVVLELSLSSIEQDTINCACNALTVDRLSLATGMGNEACERFIILMKELSSHIK
jgi:hypothetical protein